MIRGARSVSLVWKLLIPPIALLLVTGALGGFLVLRNLADEARTRVDTDLAQRALSARATAHERELYLLESATFLANLQGISESVTRHDTTAVQAALQSVMALKTDLRSAAVFGRDGSLLLNVTRTAQGQPPAPVAPTDDATRGLVAMPTGSPDGGSAIGFRGTRSGADLALATSICSGPPGCAPVGTAVVAISAAQLLPAESNVTIYGSDGRVIVSEGRPAVGSPPRHSRAGRTARTAGHGNVTLFDTLDLQGRPSGFVAVTTPTHAAFAAVRSSAVRLSVVLFAVTLGIIVIGAALSRLILTQVREVLATTRALGAGDLHARAAVKGNDEISALALGVNGMADELQASYDTLEQRVTDRTAEVQALLRERSDFFAALSHELRTPVAVFLAHADLLADDTFSKTAAWKQQSAITLKAAGNQILGFVEAILALAKAETGLDLDLDRVSVAEVVEQVRPTLEGLAGAGRVRLVFDIKPGIPAVIADPLRLRDIVVNLVDNAIKYTSADGRVDVSVGADAASVSISVRDTGVGIPADELDRVFEPFYRVRTSVPKAGQPSSGLGLALVRKLAEAQGATVEVVSAVDEGSTFTVTLPRAAPRSRRRPARVAAAPPASRRSST